MYNFLNDFKQSNPAGIIIHNSLTRKLQRIPIPHSGFLYVKRITPMEKKILMSDADNGTVMGKYLGYFCPRDLLDTKEAAMRFKFSEEAKHNIPLYAFICDYDPVPVEMAERYKRELVQRFDAECARHAKTLRQIAPQSKMICEHGIG